MYLHLHDMCRKWKICKKVAYSMQDGILKREKKSHKDFLLYMNFTAASISKNSGTKAPKELFFFLLKG